MRLLITFIVLLHINIVLEAQVYHYETGKVIPVDKPGLYNFKEGVFNSYPAEYSVLFAKENRSKTNSRLISIPIIRIKALRQDSISYPIFLLHGGPGESNLKKDFLSTELIMHHDIILMGYRGVDGQIQLDCQEIKRALFNPSLTISNSQKLFSNSLNDCVLNLKQKGIDINGYTIHEVVNDIHLVSSFFKYQKISFLSFSFGTIVAQYYAQSFPENTQNLLLVGARPANHLSIDAEVLNKQLLKVYSYFNDKKIIDSTQVLLKLKKSINIACNQYQEINPPRLLLYSFSQYYTLNNVASFMAFKYDSVNLLNSYREFYSNYPGDVLMGDVYLKKQGLFNRENHTLSDSTIGSFMAQQLNNWYSPSHDLLFSKETNEMDTIFAKTLFICGELDVASPPDLLRSAKGYFPNSSCFDIKKSSHLDFFFDSKPLMDSLIYDFYCSPLQE